MDNQTSEDVADTTGYAAAQAVKVLLNHARMTTNVNLYRSLDLIQFCLEYDDPLVAAQARSTVMFMLSDFMSDQQRGA